MIFRRRLSRKGSVWAGLATGALWALPALASPPDWAQWGRNPQHTGAAPVSAQPLESILADVVFDPFVEAEMLEGGGDLFVHYAVPLVEGGDVYVTFKSGSYLACDPPGSGGPFPCGPDAWNSQVWSVKKLHWGAAGLSPVWEFESDWRPEPAALAGWEPVFHPVLAGGYLYVPGLGGTVHKLAKATGAQISRLNPFGGVDSSRYVAGGLAAAPDGSVVYNAIGLDPENPLADVMGAWLVRLAPDGTAVRADFAALVPGAPGPSDLCEGTFTPADLPWPPSPAAVPPLSPCGAQRPALNAVPAIAPDGTIYTVSRAHSNSRYGYLVAVRPDFTPAWSASFRGVLNDGCDVLIPASGSPGGCRPGATRGVDPATNGPPAGRLSDASTASPVVLPGGGILFGTFSRYNYARGHLFLFDANGSVLGTYDFGWDLTPAVRPHGGAYSILVKDNHYAAGSYCGDPDFCPMAAPRYDITSLDRELHAEWRFTNTTAESCRRQTDGSIVCEPAPEGGFEWCVNQPAVDAAGVTYANAEDGYLYAIGPDGFLRERIFLNLALGAAYTPVSIAADGVIYTQNNGHLFAVGKARSARNVPEPTGGEREPRLIDRP